jgi:uroporphyrinogen decarboxylase
MYGDPDLWHDLLGRLAAITATFLAVQVRAGASAVQLFDSWVGALSEADYRAYVLPHSTMVLSAVREVAAEVGRDVPRIHFGVGTGELLGAMRAAGADVVGVDFRVPLDVALTRTGTGVALQGNLDPAALLAPRPALDDRVHAVLASASALPGHVFNLGHGVLPQTDPGALAHVVELVHTTTAS